MHSRSHDFSCLRHGPGLVVGKDTTLGCPRELCTAYVGYLCGHLCNGEAGRYSPTMGISEPWLVRPPAASSWLQAQSPRRRVPIDGGQLAISKMLRPEGMATLQLNRTLSNSQFKQPVVGATDLINCPPNRLLDQGINLWISFRNYGPVSALPAWSSYRQSCC